MATKTFGSEILTSSDVNTYLANSGTVFVQSQAVGSGVSSVTVTGCFSSTYDNYLVVYAGGTFSVSDTTLSVKFESGGLTTYYSAGLYVSFGGAGGYASNNGSSGGIGVGITSNVGGNLNIIQIVGPYIANYTRATGQSVGDAYKADYGGVMKTATSYSNLILLPASGTMTGGTITVYGYRK